MMIVLVVRSDGGKEEQCIGGRGGENEIGMLVMATTAKIATTTTLKWQWPLTVDKILGTMVCDGDGDCYFYGYG